jgi:hypothetical protein
MPAGASRWRRPRTHCRSNRRAHRHQPERRFPAPRHRDEDSRWRAAHSSDRRGAALPSKRSESRTFERIDELSGRRGILVRLPRRPRRRGHCCQRCTTATHIVPASLRTSGRDRCEDLTPGDASRATIRGNERSWLGTRTTAMPFRRRQPRATTRPDRTSAITIACLKEERHDHIQAATCR